MLRLASTEPNAPAASRRRLRRFTDHAPTLPLERDPEARTADAYRGRALTAWRFICDREEWDWEDEQRRTSVWSGLLDDVFFNASAVSPREWEDLAARLEEFASDPFDGTPGAAPQLEARPKRNDPAGAVPAAIRGY